MTHHELDRPRVAHIHDPLKAGALAELERLGYRIEGELLFPPETTELDRMRLDLAEALRQRDAARAACAIPPEIAAVIENLHTQDNRITESPLFAVQQKRIIGGLDNGYEDGWEWVSEDSEEIHDEDRIAELNAAFKAGDSTPNGCRRVGYKETWEFVTGCLTEAGCKAFIACNGHNMREPRIYAYGSFRNAEWKALRRWLMSLRGISAPPSAT